MESQKRFTNQTRFSRNQIESSARRLSQPKKQFFSNQTNDEDFAKAYFKANPNISLDLRSPEEKLYDINYQLQNFDLDIQEKYKALLQKMTLVEIAYGTESYEALQSHYDLGLFYNENNRPESALRHLTKAKAIQDNINITSSERISISIEMINSYLILRNKEDRVEAQKTIAKASEEMQLILNVNIEDLELSYKRDYVVAKVLATKRKFEESLKMYEMAYNELIKIKQNKCCIECGHILFEMAKVADELSENEKAIKYYKESQMIFNELGMEDTYALVTYRLSKFNNKNI
ncbi:hypothetical protein GPJ56_002296 [Histomonas meleagridis]|uniref:uncharacterized protein n=1 Tax=Histomonas meleagridis TaxID=135588 RepID=UPI00355AB1B7|nr:hypothetical protein GPJ56_002296 [Histomonas meleagridis]KAH0804557.1 hypothetical protein GO595_003387 [Histomonas meleagridis]